MNPDVPNPRAIHDAAWSMTCSVLQVIEDLNDDQKMALFDTMYGCIVEGLNDFLLKRDREWQRLHPLDDHSTKTPSPQLS